MSGAAEALFPDIFRGSHHFYSSLPFSILRTFPYFSVFLCSSLFRSALSSALSSLPVPLFLSCSSPVSPPSSFTPPLCDGQFPFCGCFRGRFFGYPSFPSPPLLSFFAGSIVVCICNLICKCFSSRVAFQVLCPIAVSLFKKFRYLINILNKILAHFLSVHYFCTRHK